MATQSKIEWCDATFNPVIGCSRVSAGCDHCYAESMSRRYGWVAWGGERRVTSDANWRKPVAWNRRAASRGTRHLVFCASLADVFDNAWPPGVRERLFALIAATPALTWLLLTKRPQNMARFLPADWGDGYPNVWLGVTAEHQLEYDRRWPIVADTPARCRFVSYEPALGPLTVNGRPDWIIWGGESGPGARRLDAAWVRAITLECVTRGIAVFGKQWGAYANNPLVTEEGMPPHVARLRDPPGHGKGGALLDGVLVREFPSPR